MTTLADLYSGDRRGDAATLAERVTIPHPLHGVAYADGVDACTHARRCTTAHGRPAR